ncbi:MAG TPA: hemerythrin domain-containing protein [Myxococcota bacterium]|nr:hemerythrin domain-containing protein [Myxococcota bacterium]
MAPRSTKKPPARRPARKPAAKKPRAPQGPLESWREGGEQLETLAKDAARALEQGQLARSREAFAEYRELLLRHLVREEDFVFPAAEKRAPAQGGPIKSLRLAHIGMRRDLDQVRAHLELDHVGAARAVFAAFLESFAAHERLEDQLEALLGKSPRSTGPGRRRG